MNNTLVSDALKSVGYVTGAVGKWHVGCASWSMTPTYRGFDSFMGTYRLGSPLCWHGSVAATSPTLEYKALAERLPFFILFSFLI